MALSIKNDDADRLARELADLTGESLTEVIVNALRQRLDHERRRRGTAKRLIDLAAEVAEYPVLDGRSPEDIVGFDERGVPA